MRRGGDSSRSGQGRCAAIALPATVPVTGPLTADAEADRHKAEPVSEHIEEDQRRIKRLIRSMIGFKSMTCAPTILSSVEMCPHDVQRRSEAHFHSSNSGFRNTPVSETTVIVMGWQQNRRASLAALVPRHFACLAKASPLLRSKCARNGYRQADRRRRRRDLDWRISTSTSKHSASCRRASSDVSANNSTN